MVLKLLLCVLCGLCGQFLTTGCADKDKDVTIRFLRSETYTFSRADRRLISGIARSTLAEVRGLLPGVPAHIEVTVRPSRDVTPETGETGDAMPPNGVMFTVDPSRPGGVAAITKAWLRPFLFHEIHHLVRYAAESPSSLIEHAVTEGMATAFERDFAGVTAPWGLYPGDVAKWATELESVPAGSPRNQWMFKHPDGRRWIGYKVGTYWVDQAKSKTGQSAADLVRVPTSEILSMASR